MSYKQGLITASYRATATVLFSIQRWTPVRRSLLDKVNYCFIMCSGKDLDTPATTISCIVYRQNMAVPRSLTAENTILVQRVFHIRVASRQMAV
jgi:hypothetical protein